MMERKRHLRTNENWGCIYIYIHIHTHMLLLLGVRKGVCDAKLRYHSMDIHIGIFIEKERERERERQSQCKQASKRQSQL